MDILEARERQVLQDLAAQPPRADYQHAAVGDNYDDNDLLDPSSVPGPDLNPFLSALIDDIKTYVSEDDDEGIGADEL